MSRVAGSAARVLAILLGLSLAWLAVTQSVAKAIATRRPDVALVIRPTQSEALHAKHEELVQAALTPAQVEAARAAIIGKLPAVTLDSAAYRQLGALADFQQSADQAKSLMSIAAQRSKRDTAAQQWLYYNAIRDEDFSAALTALDPLLRRGISASAGLAPPYIAVLAQPAALDALSRRLETAPPWRFDMLQTLAGGGTDPALVTEIFDRLAKSGSSATLREKRELASVQLRQADYVGAGRTAGAVVGKVTDGNFEGSQILEPFNWQLAATGLTFAERAPAAERGQALRVEWPGNKSDVLAKQTVLAAPGVYRLTGLVRVERIARDGWISWTVNCMGNPTVLAETRETAAGGWHPFAVDFVVPAGCPALLLNLEAISGDNSDLATAWYDDIALVSRGD